MSRTVVFVLASLMASGVSSVWVQGAWAQGAPAIVDPPTLQARQPAPRLTTLMSVQPKPLVAAAVAPSAPSPAEIRDIVYDLNVQYTEGKLWNPAENRFDTVKLRSYVGDGVDPEHAVHRPDDRSVSRPDGAHDAAQQAAEGYDLPVSGGSINMPHCFNGTNLHTHGLWVNPTGNSDNVLLSINPGVDFQYEYNIPPDHPAGHLLVPLAPARLDRAAGLERHGRRADHPRRRARRPPTAQRRPRHAAEADPAAVPRARPGDAADPVCLPRRRDSEDQDRDRIRTAPTSASRARSAASRTTTSSGRAPGRHSGRYTSSTARCSADLDDAAGRARSSAGA